MFRQLDRYCRAHRSTHRRRGAVIPLVALFLIVLIAMAAFSLDVAYMQLVRNQLQSATDIAAKAGAYALSQNQSGTQATNAAIAIAAKNQVAGHPLHLTASDITLGQTQLQSDGTWLFVAGTMPYQAVQVNSKLKASNANGTVPLFFAPLIGTKSYSPTETSVATVFACDLTLCLDRSLSMKWDLTGVDESYPTGGGDNSAPQAGSRWYALDGAIKTFTTNLSTANAPPRVGVVTWSDDATTDLDYTMNMTSVYNAVHNYTSQNFQGFTNMSGGMNLGIQQLTGSTSRSYAKKIMVLMSDGEWNEGSDPVAVAQSAATQNITIHTIALLTSNDGTTVLQNVAAATGGKSYVATDAASLANAWTNLTNSLPIVLTK